MRSVLVRGMHGLGDNLHQRAAIRYLMRDHTVWLETPWPCIYHDLVGDRLRLVSKGSRLRTQAKNAAREAAAFTNERLPMGTTVVQVRYDPADVRAQGSVLRAMLATCKVPVTETDFRLPVPDLWLKEARNWLSKWEWDGRPIMVMRPLVERKEWGGNAPRNPDPLAYEALYREIRDRFFVVSLADLEPGAEWTVGGDFDAEIKAHRGQLTFEAMAGLVKMAALTFAAPGFMPILSQAVGTPSVAVFGGYEDGRSFSAGTRWAPHLALEPINPCCCFSHRHECDKRMDIPRAIKRLKAFVQEKVHVDRDEANAQLHPA